MLHTGEAIGVKRTVYHICAKLSAGAIFEIQTTSLQTFIVSVDMIAKYPDMELLGVYTGEENI